ncbi:MULTISPECIES: GNAT family N-acetyltransferase [unclassified Jeotgalibaca]|uniref:GNAT family N-acetyltransferase n=1 Tax=unclassified Jeotgalibaca TaxID=2621505 RepID=UPI003FD1ED51
MTKLVAVKDTLQVEDIAQMADIIWREYYTPILGEDQVNYMLTHLQSEAKMIQDIADSKAEYFIVEVGVSDSGYVAIEWHEDALFLSKLYLLKEARGQGNAYVILQQLIEMAKNRHLGAIELTVNKYNDASIAFYEKIGFERIDAVVSDIGGGYVMDDFVYRLSIH